MMISLFVSLMAVLGGVLPTVNAAAPGSLTRAYIAGAEPLCSINLPGLPPPELRCPAISKADNGDTIELSGSGTFNPSPRMRMAEGGGDFVHKDADGTVLGRGEWEAKALLGFTSYGTLTLEDGTILEGGLLLLKVQLLVNDTPVFQGILQIDCEVGKVPGGHHEGIRLVVQEAGLNFHEKMQGLTVFIQ
jgi:hypothetical protein